MADTEGERRDAALDVWRATVTAEGRPPTDDRVALVRERLADPEGTLVTAERGGKVVGMGHAQPFRPPDGTGAAVAGWGHIGMVFVHPEQQRAGVGGEVMERLLGLSRWSAHNLWTGETNDRAQRLYRRFGFVDTGDRALLEDGRPIGRWERRPPPT